MRNGIHVKNGLNHDRPEGMDERWMDGGRTDERRTSDGRTTETTNGVRRLCPVHLHLDKQRMKNYRTKYEKRTKRRTKSEKPTEHG
ncbi:hypothetical protein B9Z55_027769 [Caenorhabditis nigoni]|uniref:Uncharacterized protein n=1 Tax=Caenorhabditis nigoni TaxID=1611254 RepID=A0A2G5SES2_9PELO|nr:hypothetical protein B9Z55_027769 [Caenorhabditis nigoni]